MALHSRNYSTAGRFADDRTLQPHRAVTIDEDRAPTAVAVTAVGVGLSKQVYKRPLVEHRHVLVSSIRSVSYHLHTTGNQDAPGKQRVKGRPRSSAADLAILEAFRIELSERGFTNLHLEHVAARAGVGKSTLYRRWASKEDLAERLLEKLAGPHIPIADTGNTREELLAAVVNPMRAVTDTPFGPVIRALLSQIAINPKIGDPFRRDVVGGRRTEIARVVRRGIERGDLAPDTDPLLAIELLVGPVYFRVMFGGELTLEFANDIVDAYMAGFGTASVDATREDSLSEGTIAVW